MILGLGMDLVANDRIARSLERFGDRFLARILTDAERAAAPDAPGPRALYAASRFAAKEAAVKALGTGFAGGIGPRDLEVVRLASGKPDMLLHGAAAKKAAALGARAIHLSLSHERGMACAVVILED